MAFRVFLFLGFNAKAITKRHSNWSRSRWIETGMAEYEVDLVRKEQVANITRCHILFNGWSLPNPNCHINFIKLTEKCFKHENLFFSVCLLFDHRYTHFDLFLSVSIWPDYIRIHERIYLMIIIILFIFLFLSSFSALFPVFGWIGTNHNDYR